MRKLLFTVLLLSISSFATTITTTQPIKYPAGRLFNGRIDFYLPAPATDTSTSQVVLPGPVSVQIRNGVLAFPTSSLILSGNDVLSPKMYYIARYYDVSGRYLAQYNYYISGSTFDLGSASMTPVTTSNVSFYNLPVPGFIKVSGNASFGGPNPWYDVSVAGADCTGATDSTSSISTTITSSSVNKGSTIWLPPGCNIQVTSMSFLNYQGPLTVVGGSGTFTPTPSITITGTCASSACLNLHAASDITFKNVVIKFSNCTTTPCDDQSASTRIIWDHSGLVGPGLTGPTVINLETSTLDSFWNSWCQNSAICVTGSITGSLGTLADNVTFKNFQCVGPGTVCIQNPATSWSIEDSSFGLCNANNVFAQAINFSGFTGLINLLVKNLTIVGGPGTGCNNAISFTTLPNTSPNNGTGSATFINYNPIGAAAGPLQTGITIGNNNVVTLVSPNCQQLATCISVGTGVTLNVSSPAVNSGNVTTFLSGTPSAGYIQDMTGKTTVYGMSAMTLTGNVSAVSSGFYSANGNPEIGIGGFGIQTWDASGQRNRVNACVGWSNSGSNPDSGSIDLCLSRDNPDVFDVGSSTGDTSGRVQAAGYISKGTTFTASGCTNSTLVGGATAGSFKVGQNTACTIVITMGNSATAPNGWSCSAYDNTGVPAVAIRQTAQSTTSCSLLMTVATNDIIIFSAVGW